MTDTLKSMLKKGILSALIRIAAVCLLLFLLPLSAGAVAAGQSGAGAEKHPAFRPVNDREQSLPKSAYTDLGDEQLNALCDKALALILDDSMTEPEKAYAIYTWVEQSLRYVGKPDFSSWKECALDAFTSYTGDCYAFYSVLRALLQRTGFRCAQAATITKDHYWVMAKIDGKWRHLDATPGWGGERFMLTTEELLDYCYTGNPAYPEGLGYDIDPRAFPRTMD